MADQRRLGAYSLQRTLTAAIALPVVVRLGWTPAPAMVARAKWAYEHGADPYRDFRLAGVRRG